MTENLTTKPTHDLHGPDQFIQGIQNLIVSTPENTDVQAALTQLLEGVQAQQSAIDLTDPEVAQKFEEFCEKVRNLSISVASNPKVMLKHAPAKFNAIQNQYFSVETEISAQPAEVSETVAPEVQQKPEALEVSDVPSVSEALKVEPVSPELSVAESVSNPVITENAADIEILKKVAEPEQPASQVGAFEEGLTTLHKTSLSPEEIQAQEVEPHNYSKEFASLSVKERGKKVDAFKATLTSEEKRFFEGFLQTDVAQTDEMIMTQDKAALHNLMGTPSTPEKAAKAPNRFFGAVSGQLVKMKAKLVESSKWAYGFFKSGKEQPEQVAEAVSAPVATEPVRKVASPAVEVALASGLAAVGPAVAAQAGQPGELFIPEGRRVVSVEEEQPSLVAEITSQALAPAPVASAQVAVPISAGMPKRAEQALGYSVSGLSSRFLPEMRVQYGSVDLEPKGQRAATDIADDVPTTSPESDEPERDL